VPALAVALVVVDIVLTLGIRHAVEARYR